MKDFRLTYDRHIGRYGARTHNFPKSYEINASAFDYKNDPDFSVKFRDERINFKKIIFWTMVAGAALLRRFYVVSVFDKYRRD